MSEKLISILIPVKNAEKYLEPCIQSVLAQSERNWELIAVNDDSTDRSGELLEAFEKQDNRIRMYGNEGSGITAALRTAYRHAKGDLIHRMDADDLMPFYKLEKMKNAWKPGSVVTGKVSYFSDDWMVGLGFQNYRDWINSIMETENFLPQLFVECPIPSPAWLIHTADLNAIGAFQSDLVPEDYDLCFRMIEKKLEIIVVKEIIHHWRDSQYRTSRTDPDYFPMAYYPLKVHYFLKLIRDRSKTLYLWGAGKKGKKIADLLAAEGESFVWITDNEKKVGLHIKEQKIQTIPEQWDENIQIIIAVASPDDKIEIIEMIETQGLCEGEHYWWFC